MRSLLTLISVGWILGCGGLGLAQTKIERTVEGPYRATAVSDDGVVVLVRSDQDVNPAFFRWTQTSGLVRIAPKGGSSEFWADGITSDGAIVFGTLRNIREPLHEGPAAQWTSAEGMKKIGDIRCDKVAANMDGSILYALSGNSIKRWDAKKGWQVFLSPLPPPFIGSRLLAALFSGEIEFSCSSDGRVGAGGNEERTGITYSPPKSVFWFEDGTHLPIACDDDPVSFRAISDDGSCVVGTTSGDQACLWRPEDGGRLLGILGGNTISAASGVNNDGTVVVGHCGGDIHRGCIVESEPKKAFFWTQRSGMRDLRSYLEELGMDMDSWQLHDAVDISPDGKVIVGNGKYLEEKTNQEGESIVIITDSIFLVTGLPPLTEAGPANPPLLTLVEGGPGSSPVTTIAFSLLILGWMAWYLGFRRKA